MHEKAPILTEEGLYTQIMKRLFQDLAFRRAELDEGLGLYE